MALNRRKQINTLMIFNENVSEIQPGYQYRVDFDSSTGQTASLLVYLPEQFPNARPSICVQSSASGCSHPWLNPNRVVVGAPGLVNYTVHTDLGRVVQAIKREMEKNLVIDGSNNLHNGQKQLQPSPQQQQPPVSAFSQSSVITNQSAAYPSKALPASLHQGPSTQSHVASSIPELNNLSQEEIKEMSENSVALDIFCEKLAIPMKERLDKELEALKGSVKEQSEQNITLKKDLLEAERSYGETLGKVDEQRAILGAASADINQMTDSFSVESISARLASASLSEETKSDDLAEAFLAGDTNIDDFLKNYLETRTKYHTAKVKLDKLKALRRGKW